MTSNPLQKYFRQPKLFISLPSKGLFYKEGVLTGDSSNVPIYSMTGMDEIIMKTPDALFSGEATVRLIQSCCPYITDAHEIPSLDIDALLIAIRLATYGEKMSVSHKCSNCSEENDFEIKLPAVLDQYSNKTFDNKIVIEDLIVNLNPLTYRQLSQYNIENFKLQRTLSQLTEIEDDGQRQKHLDSIYSKIAEIQVDLFLSSIDSITTPESTVTDTGFIREWLTNTVKSSYLLIKSKLEENKKKWEVPAFAIKCNNCGTEDTIQVAMDQSNFFE